MTDGQDGRRKNGRWGPGHTGNPQGRPKKPKSVSAAITKAFDEKVPVSEGGRRRRITKLEATAKQIANKSASGDTKTAKLGIELALKAEERQSRLPAAPEKLSETDVQIAERLMARLRRIQMEKTHGQDTDNSDAK